MSLPRLGASTLVFALTALLLPAAAPAAKLAKLDRDYSAVARAIIPSGQYGDVPIPKGADRQARMYDALTPRFDGVTLTDIVKDFKSERFGAPGKTHVEKVPRKGVRIVRDTFDVPHVTAKTYAGGIWAAGWIAAEDRFLLLEQARNNSRVAAIDAPGLDALGLISGLKSFVPSAQTENEIAKQTGTLQATANGRLVLKDIDTYISGINAEYKLHHPTAHPFTRNDVYALNALKGQFVGQGGGDEARRTQFLSGLESRLGAAKGLSVFNDLRQQGNPEQPVTVDGTFPYEQVPATKTGNVIIDPGSFKATPAVSDAPAARQEPVQASNELMVDAKHSTTGNPLLVGGPQIGYFYPGLTYEIDMHAPGLVWRGATSAPFPGYMLIGRGADFATTLTSASGDIIDQYAETLCGGSDTKYLYKGTCQDMGFFDAGTLSGKPVTFHSTVHGPVVGYATVGGVKVAISSKRSSYGKDTTDQLFFRDMSTGKVHDTKSFFKAAAQTPQTFNSFYIDSRHIAVYTSGLLPLRPDNVDPGLLTNGNGSEEWTGFLPASGHPQGVDPKNGRIVNWNNNLARGFGTADDEWARAGSVQRVDLLNGNLDRLAKNGKWSLATIASAMNAAATQDVRAVRTVPLLAQLLAGSAAPNARDQKMLDLLVAWNKARGSRLDRNLDGKIDDPGAAVMDAAWPKIADATMAPVLGPQLDELATLQSRYDLPPGGQYAGWHQYFDKDVRALLGDKVSAPYANRYCGGGDKAACQASVWAAIDAAGNALAAAQGPDPAAWHADANRERITFSPGLLKTTMRYANRPSGIQQVVSFDRHR